MILAGARVIGNSYAGYWIQELKLVEGVLELSDPRSLMHCFGRLFVQDFSILGKGILEDLRILPRLARVLDKTSALLLDRGFELNILWFPLLWKVSLVKICPRPLQGLLGS